MTQILITTINITDQQSQIHHNPEEILHQQQHQQTHTENKDGEIPKTNTVFCVLECPQPHGNLRQY